MMTLKQLSSEQGYDTPTASGDNVNVTVEVYTAAAAVVAV